MLSRVRLVALLLALNYVVHSAEHSKPPQEKRQKQEEGAVAPDRKVLGYTHGNVTSANPLTSMYDRVVESKQATKVHVQNDHDALPKTGVEERDRPRNRKKRMDRTMLALLMAYKLKFIALIPTLLGGLILLKGTTLLAGFFFALFAAVLGLKVH